MFNGFFRLGGTEVINSERTRKYVENEMPGYPLRRIHADEGLHVALGDDDYESPRVDDAEWFDPNDPATGRFFGMYPLSVQGIGDSTMSAEVTESIFAGGTVGEARHSSREIRLHGLLLGADELAVEAGLTWLRAVADAPRCASRSLTCDSSDLEFFLARPDVCDPKWGAGLAPVQPERVSMGKVSAATSPATYRMAADPSMPADVVWRIDETDGVQVQWGRMDLRTDTIMTRSDPVSVRRTNFVRNPSFTNDVGEWTTSTGVHLDRIAEGGVDSGPFARVIDESNPRVRVNWMPNSSFELDPVESGWRTNGLMRSEVDESAPGGGKVGVFSTRPAEGSASPYGRGAYGRGPYGGGVSSAPRGAGYGRGAYGRGPYGGGISTAYAETTLIGPSETPVTGTISLLRSPGPAMVLRLTNNLNQEIKSQAFGAVTEWTRVSMTGPIATGYVLRASTGGQEFRIDDVLVEVGAVADTYFDGGFTDDDVQKWEFAYLGEPGNSPSRFIDGEMIAFVLQAEMPESTSGPLYASFYVQSDAGAEITAKLVARSDGTVLASKTFRAQQSWQREQLATQYGRNVRLVLEGSTGSIDLDRVLVESSSSQRTYFDGSTQPPVDYRVEWLGGPHRSMSRMTWTGEARTEYHDSAWRPYLVVLDGIATVSLDYSVRESIPMDVQLEPYLRTYHRVSVTVAPKIIKRHALSTGSAIEVEMILTAATPYAYGPDRVIDLGFGTSADFLDTEARVVNIVTNPALQLNSAGWEVPPGNPVVFNRTTLANGPVAWTAAATWTKKSITGGIRYRHPGVIPRSTYAFSGKVRSTSKQLMRMTLAWYAANGTTLIGITYGQSKVVGASESTLSVVGRAPDGAAFVNVTFYRTYNQTPIVMTKGDPVFPEWPAGAVLQVYTLIGTRDGTLYPYFDGNTPSNGTYTYSFDGVQNASTSSRRMTIAVNPVVPNPLLDPDCEVVPAPPRPPAILDPCVVETPSWKRYWYDIPAESVAQWAGTVPTVTLRTETNAKRQVRVRFHPNPFGFAKEAVDPLSYCGEFILSYLPPNTSLTVSGVTRRAMALVGPDTIKGADSLLYGSGGKPMSWPEMSCAVPYVMTVDVPPETSGDLDVQLTMNRRE